MESGGSAGNILEVNSYNSSSSPEDTLGDGEVISTWNRKLRQCMLNVPSY